MTSSHFWHACLSFAGNWKQHLRARCRTAPRLGCQAPRRLLIDFQQATGRSATRLHSSLLNDLLAREDSQLQDPALHSPPAVSRPAAARGLPLLRKRVMQNPKALAAHPREDGQLRGQAPHGLPACFPGAAHGAHAARRHCAQARQRQARAGACFRLHSVRTRAARRTAWQACRRLCLPIPVWRRQCQVALSLKPQRMKLHSCGTLACRSPQSRVDAPKAPEERYTKTLRLKATQKRRHLSSWCCWRLFCRRRPAWRPAPMPRRAAAAAQATAAVGWPAGSESAPAHQTPGSLAPSRPASSAAPSAAPARHRQCLLRERPRGTERWRLLHRVQRRQQLRVQHLRDTGSALSDRA